MNKPTIIIDDKIPYIKGVFEAHAKVQYVPGKEMDALCVQKADALVVRTRTRCDEQLLRNSSVKCILTATIGYDHIDTNYCEKHNIYWKNAEGCNALAVQQYVASAMAAIAKDNEKDMSNFTVGVVGVGHVGSTIVDFCRTQNISVLLNDPFKERTDKHNNYVSLQEICERCDVITFHTPLTYNGEFPTYHIANSKLLQSLKRKPLLINAARGEVFDTQAVIEARKQNLCSALVVDCWENEPNINRELLALTDIATPHIAGYSADGKANATMACIKELVRFFGFDMKVPPYPTLPEPENKHPECDNLADFLLAVYDIKNDSDALKKSPEDFEKMRGNYHLRRDYCAYDGEYANMISRR